MSKCGLLSLIKSLPLASETPERPDMKLAAPPERPDLRLAASLLPRFRFFEDTRLSKVSSSLSDISLNRTQSQGQIKLWNKSGMRFLG
jgi:hypothetical protein